MPRFQPNAFGRNIRIFALLCLALLALLYKPFYERAKTNDEMMAESRPLKLFVAFASSLKLHSEMACVCVMKFAVQEKRARRENEREQRIEQAVVSDANNPRMQERWKLLSALRPHRLTVKDVVPDGNW